MSDYSEAELLAIEKCFPGTKVFLCDFHREQAWKRWVKDHKHRLTKNEQEELLSLLRACANVSPFHPQQPQGQIGTESEAEQGEINRLYNQAVTAQIIKCVEKSRYCSTVAHYTWLCISKVIY